jgi:hypothetical protein
VKRFLEQLMKFLLVIAIPFVILLIPYLYYDPFLVIRKYKTYYQSGKPSYVTLNNDYVATETFLSNYPAYKYDSFIFGNSRSRFYEIDSWTKYINSERCFHYDASVESLYGIYKKFTFLEENNVQIANALIVLDFSTLKVVKNSSGHLFIKHPKLSGQNKINFQFEFIKAFYSFKFLHAYLDFKINGGVKDYMKVGALLDDTPIEYNSVYNEMKLKVIDDSIKAYPTVYYNQNRIKQFYKRDSIQAYNPQIIKNEQIVMLNDIRRIFNKNNTSFKVIISPLYDQLKLNSEDVNILRKIFGDNNVFDFSGKNRFTYDLHNYYETSHYRPIVCDSIFKIIYSKS